MIETVRAVDADRSRGSPTPPHARRRASPPTLPPCRRASRSHPHEAAPAGAPNADAGSRVEKPAKTRPRLFLIDGYALIYRSCFAMINRPLTTSRGENTSAAWGLTKFLLKILEEHEPDYLGVVLDAGT